MAWYAYKDVCHNIPDSYIDGFKEKYGSDFDGDPNYDGDYWVVVADYIEDLLSEIKELKSELGGTFGS